MSSWSSWKFKNFEGLIWQDFLNAVPSNFIIFLVLIYIDLSQKINLFISRIIFLDFGDHLGAFPKRDTTKFCFYSRN